MKELQTNWWVSALWRQRLVTCVSPNDRKDTNAPQIQRPPKEQIQIPGNKNLDARYVSWRNRDGGMELREESTDAICSNNGENDSLASWMDEQINDQLIN